MSKPRSLDGLFSDLYCAEFDYRMTSPEIAETHRSMGIEPPILDRKKALEALQKARNAVLAHAWAESHDHCTSIGCPNPYEVKS